MLEISSTLFRPTYRRYVLMCCSYLTARSELYAALLSYYAFCLVSVVDCNILYVEATHSNKQTNKQTNYCLKFRIFCLKFLNLVLFAWIAFITL